MSASALFQSSTPKGGKSNGTQNRAQQGAQFVHLHVHSAFSLLEGALQVKDILELAVSDNQPAVAITDRNNLFGALEFSEKAVAKGLQPIMGTKLAIDMGDGCDIKPRSGIAEFPFLVLLATSEEGYLNLSKLVSASHIDTSDGDPPHITLEMLKQHSSDIVCLTGSTEGPLDKLIGDARLKEAETRLLELQSIFKQNLYIELQRHGVESRSVERSLIDLGYKHNIPLVATNQPYFKSKDDFEAHDALICIAEGSVIEIEERRRLSEEYYYKSQNEMKLLFRDLPEAIDNTLIVARKCTFRARTRDPILPRFTEDNEDQTSEEATHAETQALNKQAIEGLRLRLEKSPLAEGHTRQDYDDRLELELSIIEKMGFPGYFLIVADFIKWSKEQGIPVGPGRGSGAGSLVAWALTITNIDPMRFSLLFERFLNPERVSMPDFDIDFCQERREEVILYVQKKYGSAQVAQIITFGTLQARVVLRDVGRVLQMPYGQVDRICKLVPNDPGSALSLAEAIKAEPRLQEEERQEEIVGRLFDIAKRLEGLYRHASTHAAGIVIGDRRLEELVPLYSDPRSEMPVTQYNMKWVEPAGLVKFDFLGLKTLTSLEKSVEFIAQKGVEIDLEEIPLDDEATYNMLTRGETVGVFQLESQGMRKALVGMRPDCFEDIIALVALYRPGPMENIPTYNARKHGEEVPDYYHEKIESVLKETHGVIIYQEQVMQIAQILAGYSLGEADLLRRAMGKKIAEEMEKQRARFVSGCVERDLNKNVANTIFDLLAKFANYGFNKSHAAAYALVSYQTAYLRASHPVEFFAGAMQLDLGNTDKLNIFYQDAKTHGITVVPPSVQTSGVGFEVEDGKILYALAAIKGVGSGAVEHIIEERKDNGEFTSLEDFFSRIDLSQTNKRTLENLICAGALDCFGASRESILAGLERLMGHASRTMKDRKSGQEDMFGGSSGESQAIELPSVEPWNSSEKLLREFASVGYYLSAHPLDDYRHIFERMRVQLYADFEKSVRAGASAGRLVGTITGFMERKTKKGKAMGILTISDPSGQYEAVIFEEALLRHHDKIKVGESMIFLVGADMRPEGVSIRLQSMEPLEVVANREQQNMSIFLRDTQPVEIVSSVLKQRGNGHVSFIVVKDNGAHEVEVRLKDRFAVNPKIQSAIKSIPGILDVELV